jgi:hypothetical protein
VLRISFLSASARPRGFRAKLHTKAQRKRGLTFRVVVTVRDAAGNATKSTRRVVVKG